MTPVPPPVPNELLTTNMDRKLEKKRLHPVSKIAVVVLAAAVFAVVIYHVVRAGQVSTFAVSRDQVTISTVSEGVFLDFVPVRGSVMPLKTVYLDAIEGGRVEKRLVEEGSLVEAGQPILELSNTSLQLDVISREAEVTEQLNNLRNTRLATEQNRLKLKSDLVEIDYQLVRLGRLAESRRQLFEQGLIARKDYEDVVDELQYYRNRRAVTLESQEQDERLRQSQIRSLEAGIEQLQKNLEIARRNLESLTIRAPVSGRLTALNAEIGESKDRGERLGQIDDIDNFKVTAHVDEFYINRVQPGQMAELTHSGETYQLTVIKVYSQVRDGQFEVDLAFTSRQPENLRRGQTLPLRLSLGDATRALLLPRGGFFQDTGGNWAFVIDESGRYAHKRTLRLGRRNPDYFEVLEGLRSGDRVITSEYGAFAKMDRIALGN